MRLLRPLNLLAIVFFLQAFWACADSQILPGADINFGNTSFMNVDLSEYNGDWGWVYNYEPFTRDRKLSNFLLSTELASKEGHLKLPLKEGDYTITAVFGSLLYPQELPPYFKAESKVLTQGEQPQANEFLVITEQIDVDKDGLDLYLGNSKDLTPYNKVSCINFIVLNLPGSSDVYVINFGPYNDVTDSKLEFLRGGLIGSLENTNPQSDYKIREITCSTDLDCGKNEIILSKSECSSDNALVINHTLIRHNFCDKNTGKCATLSNYSDIVLTECNLSNEICQNSTCVRMDDIPSSNQLISPNSPIVPKAYSNPKTKTEVNIKNQKDDVSFFSKIGIWAIFIFIVFTIASAITDRRKEVDLNTNRNSLHFLNLEHFGYTPQEFAKFRNSLLKAESSSKLFFDSFFWFIKKHAPKGKAKKKELNIFLDYLMDILPEEINDVMINKEFLLTALKKYYSFDPEKLVEWIYQLGKWDLIVNFVKRNSDDFESEISSLINILSKYGLQADPFELKLVLGSIHGRIKYDYFKSRVNQKKPKQLNDYLDIFLEIFGEKFESDLESLIRILFENELLHKITFIKPVIERRKEEFELEIYEKKLEGSKYIAREVDFGSLTGYQFEAFLSELFKKMGYKVKNTKLSGDQGADLIIEKFKEKTAVQAKNHANPVSNKAVQEVVAAKKYYNCESCLVVSTSEYTKSAIALAKSNKVMLWNKAKLLENIRRFM